MSNKTTLQSNNALISQNNTDLQALIDTANALPDAGGGSGGGSVETCTVTVNHTVRFGSRAYVSYTNNNSIPCIDEVVEGRTTIALDVCKNTIMIIKVATLAVSISGGYTALGSLASNDGMAFFITGDAEITIEEGELT